MNDERFPVAGKALRLMLIGQLTALFSFIPRIGSILSLIGGILILVAAILIRKTTPLYTRAFHFLMAMLACSIAINILTLSAASQASADQTGTAATLLMIIYMLSLVGYVLSFMQTYYLCFATSSLLGEIDCEKEAGRGEWVWKLTAATTVLFLIASMLAFASIGIADIVGMIGNVISLIANVLYLIFLYQSSARFLARS